MCGGTGIVVEPVLAAVAVAHVGALADAAGRPHAERAVVTDRRLIVASAPGAGAPPFARLEIPLGDVTAVTAIPVDAHQTAVVAEAGHVRCILLVDAHLADGLLAAIAAAIATVPSGERAADSARVDPEGPTRQALGTA